MSAKKDNATIVCVGVAACAACCAGPILAVLAAIGLGTAAGFALFGTVGAMIAALVGVVVYRVRRPRTTCAPDVQAVAIEPPKVPASR